MTKNLKDKHQNKLNKNEDSNSNIKLLKDSNNELKLIH